MTAKSDKKVLKEIKRFNNQKYRDYNKYLKRKRVPENEYITVMKDPNNILEIDNLQAYFYTDIGTVKAVDGVTFDVPMGKTIGVVGESGCGKSVTGLSIMRLLQSPQGQITGGEIRLNQVGLNRAVNIPKMPLKEVEKIRGKEIAMIFQEPMTSLNPVFTIGDQIDEIIELHNPNMNKNEVKARTIEMLNMVGIPRAEGSTKLSPRAFRRYEAACHDRHGIVLQPSFNYRRRTYDGIGRYHTSANIGFAGHVKRKNQLLHHADHP